MIHKNFIFIIILALLAATLACSISGIQQKATTARQTANALRTDVGGVVSEGESIIATAEAVGTQHPGIVETVKAIATQGAPVLSTIQAVTTDNPGLVQTAQAIIQQELPTGVPPEDIPIIERDHRGDYFGSGRYIFYTSSDAYQDVLQFYKTEMPKNGWEYLDNASHEFANAAQLVYEKDNRIATVNISANPLNNTTVVVINIDL